MKKLLLCLVISIVSTYSSYSVKELQEGIHEALLHSELMDIIAHMEGQNFKGIKERMLNKFCEGTLFPGVNRFIRSENETGAISINLDENNLAFFHHLAETYPVCRPFVKQGYTRFIARHNKKPGSPSKEIIDSYPDSFEEGTGAAIILGPLLNPGKMTKAEYEKNVADYYKPLEEKIKFFLLNRSNVLFPGIVRMLDTIFNNAHTFKIVFDQIKEPADPQKFSKLDKDRDLGILKNFWQESINDAGLLPFIEKGHANFVKAYKCQPPVRSIPLKNGLTLGNYSDMNKQLPIAALCNRLEPVPSSKFLRKTIILGILGGISYLAYKKYKAKTSLVNDSSKTQIA